jgi:hypothetical protein
LHNFFPKDNDRSLKGVAAFDARLYTLTWLGVEGDRSRFESNALAAFEVALRRDGVIVDLVAPNYLICNLKFAQNQGLVFYSYEIEYWQWSSDGLHTLTWANGGVATVGSSNFNARDVAQDCVDLFTNQWLKHNPR